MTTAPSAPPVLHTSGSTGSRRAPPLEVHDLTVAYRKQAVLYGLDLVVPEGQLVGIIGPNGAGKSTFIKAVMDLVPTLAGWVKIYGQPFRKAVSRVGYVPQRESVDWDFPVTVEDVVLMGRYGQRGLLRRPTAEDRAVVRACLEKVRLLPLARRQIAQLSGGQQQRVFLARALAQESDLYLMDEPFAGVDAATETAIMEILGELKARGKTIIVVHHDLPTARQYFDQLLLLNMRVVAFGPTAEVFTRENLEKTYGGSLTILTEVADRRLRNGQPR